MNDQRDSSEAFTRRPPCNIDAEQAVLGSMMLAPNMIIDVVEELGGVAAPFYRPAHETIFNSLLTQFANGRGVDPITMANYLQHSGDLDRVGGAPYLHTLVQSVPTAANATYYAEILRNLALLRAVIVTGTDLVQMGYQAAVDAGQAAEVVDGAAAKLQQLVANVEGGADSREWQLDRVVNAVLDEYNNPTNNNLPLPWADMEVSAPMEPGDLVVVAGRPGMGKTIILMEIARHVAIRYRRAVLVASMEMSHLQIGQRIVAAEAEVSLHELRARLLDEKQMSRVHEARTKMAGSPLHIDDTPTVPVAKWRQRLRQLQAKNQLPDVLVVDYLQIAKAEAKAGGNRTGEVDAIAVGLKALAQEFQIVVIAAAQLNRVSEQRSDKTPTLSDLRESGGIENNANIVVLLHREDYYNKESPRSGEFDFIIAKNRMGKTCTITAGWKGHQSRVVDMAAD
ncbi:replicative DNA helicase [Streptomyces microflavus]|uniref:replicative DNA helicase n=1 Tax=Streptomyces microflavus TaxID=1919 RepID=UPI0034215C8A